MTLPSGLFLQFFIQVCTKVSENYGEGKLSTGIFGKGITLVPSGLSRGFSFILFYIWVFSGR